jgi:hypothetical protein
MKMGDYFEVRLAWGGNRGGSGVVALGGKINALNENCYFCAQEMLYN